MPKTTHPRRGSIQFTPRSRARSPIPHVKLWVPKEGSKILGFSGYKVGSTQAVIIENRPKNPVTGKERRLQATVIEVPPVKVVGYRVYSQDFRKSLGEVWAEVLPKELGRRLNNPKKTKDPEPKVSGSIRMIVCTQPHLAGFGKKIPEIMEVGIAGTPEQQLAFAKEMLGKEIKAKDVLKAGDYLDVFSVTKGKGFQGPVKRHGVVLQPPKTKRSRRKPANIGGWRPKHTLWQVPMGGQMGYNQRCEFNKRILSMAENGIVTKDGWKHYGQIRSDYMLLLGSVGGPSKRLIRFRFASRPPHIKSFDIPSVASTGMRVGEEAAKKQ